jgi:hypothetical protein
MKINAIRRLQIALFLLFAAASYAQEASFNQHTIRSQFDYILENSESYKGLKIVKTKWLVSLRESMVNSYSETESQLLDTKSLVNTQEAEIDQLKLKLKETNALLSVYANSGSTVTFLGMTINKNVFTALVILFFLSSGLSLAFYAIRFQKANTIAQHSKNVLSDLEQEYQEHKQRAMEREQKISRQLLDEINKQKQFLKMKAS